MGDNYLLHSGGYISGGDQIPQMGDVLHRGVSWIYWQGGGKRFQELGGGVSYQFCLTLVRGALNLFTSGLRGVQNLRSRPGKISTPPCPPFQYSTRRTKKYPTILILKMAPHLDMPKISRPPRVASLPINNEASFRERPWYTAAGDAGDLCWRTSKIKRGLRYLENVTWSTPLRIMIWLNRQIWP